MPGLAACELNLRPAGAGDRAFFRALYHEVRAAEFAALPPEQRAMVLDMQFEIQGRAYEMQSPGAVSLVVEEAGVVEEGRAPLGRLILHRSGPVFQVVDIAVSAVARGRGLGAAVLGRVLDMARAAGSAGVVVLSVRPGNPAQRLYARLGFTECEGGTAGISIAMIWRQDVSA